MHRSGEAVEDLHVAVDEPTLRQPCCKGGLKCRPSWARSVGQHGVYPRPEALRHEKKRLLAQLDSFDFDVAVLEVIESHRDHPAWQPGHRWSLITQPQ